MACPRLLRVSGSCARALSACSRDPLASRYADRARVFAPANWPLSHSLVPQLTPEGMVDEFINVLTQAVGGNAVRGRRRSARGRHGGVRVRDSRKPPPG